MTQGADNVERYRDALDAWNRRDLVWILEQAAPELEFHTAQLFPGLEPVYRGREGMVEFWTTFIEEPWALFRLEVESLEAVDDGRVLALITFHGTERDSGEEISHSYAHLATFEGELVSRIDAFTD
jgi:ketosteroid isomerase-like protein